MSLENIQLSRKDYLLHIYIFNPCGKRRKKRTIKKKIPGACGIGRTAGRIEISLINLGGNLAPDDQKRPLILLTLEQRAKQARSVLASFFL